MRIEGKEAPRIHSATRFGGTCGDAIETACIALPLRCGLGSLVCDIFKDSFFE